MLNKLSLPNCTKTKKKSIKNPDLLNNVTYKKKQSASFTVVSDLKVFCIGIHRLQRENRRAEKRGKLIQTEARL